MLVFNSRIVRPAPFGSVRRKPVRNSLGDWGSEVQILSLRPLIKMNNLAMRGAGWPKPLTGVWGCTSSFDNGALTAARRRDDLVEASGDQVFNRDPELDLPGIAEHEIDASIAHQLQ